MKTTLVPHLASPCCGADLKMSRLGEFPRVESHDIQEGALQCVACKSEYPIREGVPRLVLEQRDRRVIKTRDSFAFEWARYPGSLPEDERVFLEETQLPAAGFKGKLVLDAGCGMGRYSVVAMSLGAEVVALDLSESLSRVAAVAKDYPKLHVVQGDLLKPPLKAGAFDIVYSQGVLHHTSDTHAAFTAVSALVKPGGSLSVWLYGKAGRFADFATNPLRIEGGWTASHRRAAWVIVGARHFISDCIRLFTTRLPMRLSYVISWALAFLGALPFIKYLTFSVHPDFKVRVIENFDWISPPFQYHHTKEELRGWFEAAGFSGLKVLPHGLVPKPGILGRRDG